MHHHLPARLSAANSLEGEKGDSRAQAGLPLMSLNLSVQTCHFPLPVVDRVLQTPSRHYNNTTFSRTTSESLLQHQREHSSDFVQTFG